MNNHADSNVRGALEVDPGADGAIVDIAVIGGGIFGCVLAHRAADKFPGRRIVLFEQGAIGGGCSGFAGALATPAVRSEFVRPLSDESRAWYACYRRDHVAAPMRELPILYVANEHSSATLVSLLSPARIRDGRDRAPDWLVTSPSERVHAGPTALWADVRALCAHLVSLRPSVEAYEGTRVDGYRREDGVWRLCVSDGRQFSARRLVVAKGAWLDDVERSGLAPMRNKMIVAFVIAMPAREDDAVIYFHDHEAFLLPLPTRGCWLLSVVSTQWDVRPCDGDMQACASDLATAEQILSRFAPALLPLLRGARVHCDGYLDRHHPRASVLDGAVFMYGGSGSGFRYAPAVAASALNALTQPAHGLGSPA